MNDPVAAVTGVREGQELVSLAEANPLIAAGAVFAFLILLWIGIRLFRRFRRPPGVKFSRVLRGCEEVTILTHPNPDPDAMGAAMGAAKIAEHAGADVTIRYPGEVRHHQNRAFRTVLDIDMERVESVAELTDVDVVLVDHNTPRGLRDADELDPIAVVDHHPGDGMGSAFTDVRTEYGACSTILAEYLQELNARLIGPEEQAGTHESGPLIDTETATGLLFGILSDTSHLTIGCTDAEFDASAYLYQAVDPDMLDRIANPRVDAETLDVKADAISSRDVRSPYAVSDVGSISNVDAIPQAAGELVELETVTAVVVLGSEDGTIHLSGRSRDDRVHMGDVMESVIDEIPMSSGGGHARMGGAQLDIDHMRGIGPGRGIDRDKLAEWLFAAMSGREIAGVASEREVQ